MADKRWDMANYSDLHRLQGKVEAHFKDKCVDMIVQQMQYIGEACVSIARDKARANTWKDRTGNLRSSIGYVVQNNGIPVVTGPVVQFAGEDGNGGKGPQEARNLMKSLRGTKQSGVVLTVVAGMDYAEYVESIHGKDVLATSWQEGEKLAKRLLSRLFGK